MGNLWVELVQVSQLRKNCALGLTHLIVFYLALKQTEYTGHHSHRGQFCRQLPIEARTYQKMGASQTEVCIIFRRVKCELSDGVIEGQAYNILLDRRVVRQIGEC